MTRYFREKDAVRKPRPSRCIAADLQRTAQYKQLCWEDGYRIEYRRIIGGNLKHNRVHIAETDLFNETNTFFEDSLRIPT